MKNSREATHNHKREGAVVVLESTLELAKVTVLKSGEEFWVKLIDLTPWTAGAVEEGKSGQKRAKAGLAKAGVRAA